MKRITAVLMIIVLMLTLCACSALSLEEEDILSIPNASGDESEILSLIASNFSSSFELIYPLSGENKSAVTVSDDRKLAVALFRLKDDPASVTVLFAKKENAGFSYIGSSDIPTGVIDRVDFADISDSSADDILIGYQGASSALRSVAVYEIGEQITVTDVPACYQAILYGDFNKDNKDEALCIRPDPSEDRSRAVLMGYTPILGLGEISSCELNTDIVKIESFIFGQIDDTHPGAALDILNSDDEYATEILYYDRDQKALIDPLFIYDRYSDTVRDYPLFSKDINGDGIIEIPFCYASPRPDEDERTFCDTVEWESPDSSDYTLHLKKTAFICPDGSYTLTVPENMTGAVTAVYDAEERKLSVLTLDYEKGALSVREELMYIKAYSKDAYNQNRVIEAKLCELSSTVYTYLILDAAGDYFFTEDEVEKGFEMIQTH